MRTKLLALRPSALAAAAGRVRADSGRRSARWTTVDDEDRQAQVDRRDRTQAKDGSRRRPVAEILQSDRGRTALRQVLAATSKDKPVKGMAILWGIKQTGDAWEGGTIARPGRRGKVYWSRSR